MAIASSVHFAMFSSDAVTCDGMRLHVVGGAFRFRGELHVLQRSGHGALDAISRPGHLDGHVVRRQPRVRGLQQRIRLGAGIERVQDIAAIQPEVVDAPFEVGALDLLHRDLRIGDGSRQETLHARRVLPARHDMADVGMRRTRWRLCHDRCRAQHGAGQGCCGASSDRVHGHGHLRTGCYTSVMAKTTPNMKAR